MPLLHRCSICAPSVWNRPHAGRWRSPSAEVRCFSKKRKENEKSWTEIVEEAADVAKAVVGKMIKAGQDLVKGSEKRDRVADRGSERGDYNITRPGDLLSSMMGQAMGQWMGNVFRGLSEQIAETQRQTRDVYSIAVERLQNSQQIRSAMGSVSCGPPYSQSSSSQSINGVTSKQTVIEFPISGSKGDATVRVNATEDSSRNLDIKINVPFSLTTNR